MVDKYVLPMTGEQVERTLDGRLHSPIQDIVGDDYTAGVPLPLIADTEVNFICNGAIRNSKVFPAHITNIWNTTTSIATFAEFDNTPMIVANVSFMFDPSVSSAGTMNVKAYVNETVPILINSTNIDFKGETEKLTALLTFYAGADSGFDVKNKGVFFTIEASAGGTVYDPSIVIYRT